MILNHCPICSKELVYTKHHPTLYSLECPNHFACDVLNGVVKRIALWIDNNIFYFDYAEQYIRVISNNTNTNTLFANIPWFVPDFSDISKLTSKLNTYMVFQ